MAGKRESMKAMGIIVLFLGVLIWAKPVLAADQKPIKIGFEAELSGVYAREGIFMERALKLAFEETGNKVAGRDIQIFVEDQEMKPDVAVTKAKKLVERDGCQILVGNFASSTALAVRDYAHTKKVPFLSLAGAATFLLRTTKKSPYVWLGGPTAGANMYALPSYLTAVKGLKRAIVMVPDYSYGLDCAAWYKVEVERTGGKIVQEIHTPFPTMDFSPYVTSFKEADVVYADYSGGDAVRIVRQIREAGLPLEIAGAGTFQPGTTEMMDPKYAVGGWGSLNYITEIDTAENKAFLKAYKAKYNDEAGINAAFSYASTWALIHALKAVNGNIENTEKFLKALSDVDYTGLWGRWFFEKETHSLVMNNYVYRIEKSGDKTKYVIAHEVKEVRVSDVLKKLGK